MTGPTLFEAGRPGLASLSMSDARHMARGVFPHSDRDAVLTAVLFLESV